MTADTHFITLMIFFINIYSAYCKTYNIYKLYYDSVRNLFCFFLSNSQNKCFSRCEMNYLLELIECSLLHLIMRVNRPEVAICRLLRVYTSLGGCICTSDVSCLPCGRIRLAFIVLRRSRKWTFHDRLFSTHFCYDGRHANTRLQRTSPTLID